MISFSHFGCYRMVNSACYGRSMTLSTVSMERDGRWQRYNTLCTFCAVERACVSFLQSRTNRSRIGKVFMLSNVRTVSSRRSSRPQVKKSAVTPIGSSLKSWFCEWRMEKAKNTAIVLNAYGLCCAFEPVENSLPSG